MMSENRTEAEREFGSYEEIGMPDHLVPVKIVPRRMDLHSVGCSFHWHEALEFYCVEQGGVLLLCGGRREWIRAGETGFVNWCRPHRGMAFLADTRYHIVQIGPELFSGETLLLPGQKEPCGYLSLLLSFGERAPVLLPTFPDLAASLRELIRLYYEPGPAVRLEEKAAVLHTLAALAKLLIASPGRGESPQGSGDRVSLEHVRSLLLFLSENYADPERVSLPALSRRFGLSTPYLCRIFRRCTGMSIVSHLQELRCTRAAAFILSGTPLREAAERAGFQDYNYFSRVFRQRMGISPLALKKPPETGGSEKARGCGNVVRQR